VRALHWNVNVANPDVERALAWILEHELELDAIVLLEVGPAWRRELDLLGRFYPHSEVRLRDDHFGIAVFSRLPGTSLRLLTRPSGFQSVVLTAATATGAPLALWAVHLPPPVSRASANERNAQLVSVARTTRDAPLPMVVVGDLNVTPWSPWFRRLLQAGRLTDLGGGPQRPTWAPAPLPGVLGLPLDHALATPGIRLLHRRLGPRLGSDHHPVLLHLEVLAPAPG
jgi:endonuclease/exonuclease/phosphatase (EEP) superfamily protein YafD